MRRAFLVMLVAAALVQGQTVSAEAPVITPTPAAPLPALTRPARVIVLDAGHGGKDSGAMRRGHREKDLALAMTRKLRDRLEKDGVATRLTRDADVYIPLDQRINDSIAWEGAAFVSLHLNQDRNTRAEGIEVYAFGNQRPRRRWRSRHRLPPLPAPPASARAASSDLASTLVADLRASGLQVDQPNRAGFYVLKNPKLPSVLIELGYLSNASDAARLADPAYQDKLTLAIAASLKSYITRLEAPPAPVAAKK